MKAKLYRQPPSEIIGLSSYLEEIAILPGPDEIATYLFNNAVEYLGRWIDSKLNTLDKEGKPVHHIDDLLADRAMTNAKVTDVMGMFGGEMISLDALMNDPAYCAQVEAGLVKPPPNWPTTQH